MTNAAIDAAGSTIAAVSNAMTVLLPTWRQKSPDWRIEV